MNFYGYRRPDGRVGVRNHVLILPASVCASDTTRIISQQVTGSVTFNNQNGCSQELKFKAPVRIGDTITCTATIIEKIPEKHRLILSTVVTNQDGVVVTDGKAVMLKK